jgi:hypothetical protein
MASGSDNIRPDKEVECTDKQTKKKNSFKQKISMYIPSSTNDAAGKVSNGGTKIQCKIMYFKICFCANFRHPQIVQR